MKRQWIAAFAAVVGSLGAVGAQAANVYWSVGIQAPPIATVISNGPAYQPYYQAPPAYYAPAPVYYQPAPVYVPPSVVYRPYTYVPQVVYQGHGHGHGGWQRRDEYGTAYQRGWAPRDERRRHH